MGCGIEIMWLMWLIARAKMLIYQSKINLDVKFYRVISLILQTQKLGKCWKRVFITKIPHSIHSD